MKRVLKMLASLKLTLAGLAGLLVACLAIAFDPGHTVSWLALPLSVLAINLAAALLSRHAFRQQAFLLLFHVGLLLVLLLVGAGLLIRFDGRVEIVEGAAFAPGAVSAQNIGWLHAQRFDRIDFEQQEIEVHFLANLRRDKTRSRVTLRDRGDAEQVLEIGDRHGFVTQGYRFMTTPNKGYALLLNWRDDAGQQVLGAVNFPSFPEYEWKQVNSWITPAGESISLELELADAIPASGAWDLKSAGTRYSVIVASGDGIRRAVRPGQVLRLRGGSIEPAGLRLWMGYSINYDPLLPWLLAAALLTLTAMAAHFVSKLRLPGIRRESASIAEGEAA